MRDLADGAEHTVAFDEEAYSPRPARRARLRHGDDPLRLLVDDDAVARPGTTNAAAATATLRKRQAVPSGHDPAAYVTRRLFATAPDGAAGADLAAAPAGPRRSTAARRCCSTATAPTARDAGRASRTEPAQPGRSRLRLRHRAYPRRRREGLGLVSRRQAREEAQHLHRLHRLRRAPDRGRLRPAGADRRPWRLGGRHADGRGRQPARRSCSPASWPTCRSSTCSTPCSTRACR